MWLSFWSGHLLTKWFNPPTFLIVVCVQGSQTTRLSNYPKGVFFSPPLAVSFIMLSMRRGRHSRSWLHLRFLSLSHDKANKAPDSAGCILGLFLLPPGSVVFIPCRCQRVNAQQYPSSCKELLTLSRSRLHPHFSNVSVYGYFPNLWLLHITARVHKFFRGCRPSAAKGLRCALIHSSAIAAEWTRP
jgi:hypothetical protein